MRAAKALGKHLNAGYSHDEIARIIDRETGLGELVSTLKEALAPGVFGELRMIDQRLPDTVRQLCETHGYGSVMAHAAYLWNKKTPGCGHTVAACGSVRARWIKDARAALSQATKAQ